MRRFWRNRNRREKVLILVALVAVMAYFGLERLWFPLYAEYAALQKQHRALEAQVERGLELSRQQEDLQAELAEVEAEYDRLTDKFPVEEEIPSLLRDLEETFAANDVSLESLEPGEADVGDQLAVLPISVSFSGSRTAVQELLFALEGLPRHLHLHGADLNLAPGDASGTLNFSVFYLDPESGEPGEDGG